MLHTVNGGAAWTAQTIGITADQFYDIYFIDENNGWVSGNKGQILHTSDGGATWNSQTSGIYQTHEIRAIKFMDSNNGWATSTGGEIIHSTDGGNTWTSQHIVNYSTNGFDFHIINQNKLLATGNMGPIVNTTDGGNEWNQFLIGSGSSFYAIHFIDQNNGWAAGDKGTIARTSDGGATWAVKTHLSSVDFIDANHGWAGGGSNVLHTVNGGNSWTLSNNWAVGYIYDIFCLDTDHVWAANCSDGGSISVSSDGGVNWYSSFIENSTDIFSICFTDINKGWSVVLSGMNQVLKHTEDGGAIWYEPYDFGEGKCFCRLFCKLK
ncbi:MAG: YCF48-related protein [Candidatus Eremiobacterota bacterium]